MKLLSILVVLPMLLLGADSDVKPIVIGKKIKSFDVLSKVSKIKVDLNVLRDQKNFKQKQAITIEIAEGKSLTFIPKRFKSRKKDGDFSWVGVSKDKKSKAILSIRNGVMVGTIICEDAKYKIHPEQNHYKVTKVDASKALPFHDDMVVEPKRVLMPLPKLLNKSNKSDEPQKQESDDNAQSSEDSSDEPQEQQTDDNTQASEANSSDSIITLLVYYTQALKDKYGDATEAMVQSNLDIAKDSYIDSDTEINLQVTIIKQVAADTLLYTADSTTGDLLDKLRADGLVRYEREFYSADAVTVFSAKDDDSGSSCGLASTPETTEDTLVRAFSAILVKPSSEGGYYCSDLTYAHELGHNFGCYHDSDHASGTPMYDYAYGYDLEDEFATIMSYDSPKIGFFSNPRMTYYQSDTGNTSTIGDEATADNARTIKENQFKMADNSEQISEVLESGDNENDYAIDGTLNTQTDRDGYIIGLGGDTTFSIDNEVYGNNPFYLNLYNEDTHEHVASFNDDETQINLTNARYRVTMAFSNDETGGYFNLETIDYTVDIQTNYVEPDERAALDDTATLLEDSSVDIDVIFNDEENSHGKSAVASVTHGSNGAVAKNDDGTVKYTPALNFFGEDSFTYTNEDGFSATVSMTITAVEDETIVVNDAATTSEEIAVDIDVLLNDTDVDGDTKSTVDSVTQGSNGAVTINEDGTIKYTPNKDFFGEDSFTYTNTEGNTATVSVTTQEVEANVNISPIINYLLF